MRHLLPSCFVAIVGISLIAVPAAAQEAPAVDASDAAGAPPAVPEAHAPVTESSRSTSDAKHEPTPAIPPWRKPIPEDSEGAWYGWQTLTVDAAALTTMVAGGLAGGEVFGYGGLGGYVLGSPIVHVVHGRPLRGLGSLGLRVALPILGVVVATRLGEPCGGDFGCLGEGVLGATAGVVGAIAIDAAVLAYDEPPPPTRQALTARPFAYVDRQGALLGVGGTF